MSYLLTRDLLRAAEQTLIGGTFPWSRDGRLGAYADTILVGPWLVLAGVRILAWRFVWIIAAWATFGVVFAVVGDGRVDQVAEVAFFLAVGVVYCSVPSRLLDGSIKSGDLAAVREVVLSRCAGTGEIKSLKEGLQIIRTQAGDRMARFSAAAGVVWGVLFWYVATHALAPGLAPELVSKNLSFSFAATFIFGIVLLIGACYSSALRAIYLLLEFALLEALDAKRQAGVIPQSVA